MAFSGHRRARPRARALEPFELTTNADGQPQSTIPKGVLGASSAPLLPRLGAARIVCEGERVTVLVHGVPDPKRARLAAELAAHIALGEPREGLFR